MKKTCDNCLEKFSSASLKDFCGAYTCAADASNDCYVSDYKNWIPDYGTLEEENKKLQKENKKLQKECVEMFASIVREELEKER